MGYRGCHRKTQGRITAPLSRNSLSLRKILLTCFIVCLFFHYARMMLFGVCNAERTKTWDDAVSLLFQLQTLCCKLFTLVSHIVVYNPSKSFSGMTSKLWVCLTLSQRCGMAKRGTSAVLSSRMWMPFGDCSIKML